MLTLEPALIVGKAFTVTVTLALFWQPLALVPVTVYIVVDVGFAVGLLQVTHDKPVVGAHE